MMPRELSLPRGLVQNDKDGPRSSDSQSLPSERSGPNHEVDGGLNFFPFSFYRWGKRISRLFFFMLFFLASVPEWLIRHSRVFLLPPSPAKKNSAAAPPPFFFHAHFLSLPVSQKLFKAVVRPAG